MDFLESGAVTLVDIAFIRQHVTMLLESVNKGVSQGIKHQAVPKVDDFSEIIQITTIKTSAIIQNINLFFN